MLAPAFDLHFGFLQVVEELPTQALIAELTIEVPIVAVLPRRPWLDEERLRPRSPAGQKYLCFLKLGRYLLRPISFPWHFSTPQRQRCFIQQGCVQKGRATGATKILPLGSLCEGAQFVTFKPVALRLADILGVSATTLRSRDTILE